MPKTGGTFVTTVLERLHSTDLTGHLALPLQPRLLSAIMRIIKQFHGISTQQYGHLLNLEPKHATCNDIPDHHRHKLILSNVRNPYDWYVSQYEFGWWKRTFMYDPADTPTPVGYAIEQVLPEFVSQHVHFPNITFREFLELCKKAEGVYNEKFDGDLGLYTYGFIQFFYKNTASFVSRVDQNYLISGRHLENAFNVHFLNTEHLNRDLYDFLASQGYRTRDLDFIPKLGRVLPMSIGRTEDQKWEHYYDADLKDQIRETDWVLFSLFPEFDV